MTNTLPAGWIKTTLGEALQPSRQRALPAVYPDLPYPAPRSDFPALRHIAGNLSANVDESTWVLAHNPWAIALAVARSTFMEVLRTPLHCTGVVGTELKV